MKSRRQQIVRGTGRPEVCIFERYLQFKFLPKLKIGHRERCHDREQTQSEQSHCDPGFPVLEKRAQRAQASQGVDGAQKEQSERIINRGPGCQQETQSSDHDPSVATRIDLGLQPQEKDRNAFDRHERQDAAVANNVIRV